MLDPAQWDVLRGLTLSSRALVEGALPGRHAAMRTGAGSEFHDYRPYVPGDDLSQLDWKAYGRSDRFYLRRHRRETELTAHVLVDASASMDFAGLDANGRAVHDAALPTKRRYALDLAMGIALTAVRQGDRAGIGVYGATLREYLPPGGTWAHLHRMSETLGAIEPGGEPADAAAALQTLHQRGTGRSLVIVVSDFLDASAPAGFFAGADRLRHAGAEIAAMQVLTPTELNPAHVVRPMRLVDPETRRGVSTRPAALAEGYRQRLSAHLERFRAGCASRGMGHHLLRTDEPVATALRRVLGSVAAGRG